MHVSEVVKTFETGRCRLNYDDFSSSNPLRRHPLRVPLRKLRATLAVERPRRGD